MTVELSSFQRVRKLYLRQFTMIQGHSLKVTVQTKYIRQYIRCTIKISNLFWKGGTAKLFAVEPSWLLLPYRKAISLQEFAQGWLEDSSCSPH